MLSKSCLRTFGIFSEVEAQGGERCVTSKISCDSNGFGSFLPFCSDDYDGIYIPYGAEAKLQASLCIHGYPRNKSKHVRKNFTS